MKAIKKYKFTILSAILWFATIEFILYANLNKWEVNSFLAVNIILYAVVGLAVPMFVSLWESDR